MDCKRRHSGLHFFQCTAYAPGCTHPYVAMQIFPMHSKLQTDQVCSGHMLRQSHFCPSAAPVWTGRNLMFTSKLPFCSFHQLVSRVQFGVDTFTAGPTPPQFMHFHVHASVLTCPGLCVSTPSLGAFMCASVAGPGTAQFNCWEGQGNRAGQAGHGSSRGQGSNTGQSCSAAGQGSAGHRCSAMPPRSFAIPQPSPISQDSPASALQLILFNQDHHLVKISSHNVSTKLVCMLIGAALDFELAF